MGFHKLVNTAYFSEAANDWHRNGGVYTKAPRGSREYVEYWEEQERRCMVGYQVGDLWIPGRHYHFLNFFPIWKVPDNVAVENLKEARDRKGKISKKTAERIFDFPKFWEVHYEVYNFKHIAWNGGEFMGIHSDGGQHFGMAKTRGSGFSYTEAAEGVYNYTFLDGSKSYYFAGMEAYLLGDGIMPKVLGGLDWINANVQYWRKNRKVKNTPMHYRASYIDAQGTEQGTMSEIIAQVVDNPNKTRGKRGRKATLEEGGSFINMKSALEILMGSMRDGSVYVGQVTVGGTGGEEGPGIEGLQDVFDNPEEWDMLAFNNIYENGMESTSCGYFVPCWRANSSFMDEDGNIDIELAIQADDVVRAKKAKSKDPKALDRRKAEYPRYPSEAFQRVNFNMFPVAEAQAQLNRVRTDTAIQQLIRHGNLVRKVISDPTTGVIESSFVEFKLDPKAKPVKIYPHKRTDDLTGCITIYEQPFKLKGVVPAGLYQIVIDPFYKDESEDLTSLFVVYVLKNYNSVDPVSEGLPVASYIGRPADLYHAYEQAFMLADYYNCMIQSEVAGGGKGIIDYARERKYTHKLNFEVEMLHGKDYETVDKNKSIFMNMPTEKKTMGLTYLADWAKRKRGLSLVENAPVILNIHRIYDEGLLLEFIKFNKKGNFDRISALIIGMFMLKENAQIQASTEEEEESDFFSRQFFSEEAEVETGSIGYY